MLGLHDSDRLYLYSQSTDMRKGFDGLSGLVQNVLRENPCSGDVFIFLNKDRNRIKLLRWEHDGFSIYYKRLERGRIELPKKTTNGFAQPLAYAHLVMMLKGISLEQRVKRARFSFEQKE